MPSKNTIKIYIADGIYHVYNRGVEKRLIFLDEQDYKIFLYYLKSYLTPVNQQTKPPAGIRYLSKFSLYNEIKLFAFCLMPNHFHLMLKQLTERAIIGFMKRLSNAYVEYFNKKYKRTGSLFQGRYKTALVDKDDYLLHLSRYIHINPLELFKNEKNKFKKLREYPYSSYSDYIGERNSEWISQKEIMDYFKSSKDKFGFSAYQEFVEEYLENSCKVFRVRVRPL